MTNQFTGCKCDAPTPERCICEAMKRVVETSEPVSVLRPGGDGRWINPSAMRAFLQRHNPDVTMPQPTASGEQVVADGGEPT